MKTVFFLIETLGLLIHEGVKQYQDFFFNTGIVQDKPQVSFHLIQNDLLYKKKIIFCFESDDKQKINKTLPSSWA